MSEIKPNAATPTDGPGRQRRGASALTALVLAASTAVIVFLPPAGRIAAPLHDAAWALLGQASFMLPLGLAFVGLMLLVTSVRPNMVIPRRRVVGLGLIAVSLPPSEHLLSNGEQTGLIGRWLSNTMLDLLTGPGTLLLLLVSVGLGIWLALDLRLPRARRRADAEG